MLYSFSLACTYLSDTHFSYFFSFSNELTLMYSYISSVPASEPEYRNVAFCCFLCNSKTEDVSTGKNYNSYSRLLVIFMTTFFSNYIKLYFYFFSAGLERFCTYNLLLFQPFRRIL